MIVIMTVLIPLATLKPQGSSPFGMHRSRVEVYIYIYARSSSREVRIRVPFFYFSGGTLPKESWQRALLGDEYIYIYNLCVCGNPNVCERIPCIGHELCHSPGLLWWRGQRMNDPAVASFFSRALGPKKGNPKGPW